MSSQDHAEIGRENLPIPNEPYTGPVLYDAKDPAVVYPPIQEIRPPKIAKTPRGPASSSSSRDH
jgi:hypothetical protein